MFIDPPRSLYLVLIVVTIVTAALCANFQTRRWFLIALGCATALLGLYLTDLFVESPREEASRRVTIMAAAATDSNPRGFLEQVSSSFNANGRTKADLESSPAWALIRQFNARVTTWGFTRDDFKQVSDNEIEIGFRAKAQGGDGAFLERYVRAGFVKDGNAWKMKSIRFYSIMNTEKEEPIPGFP